VETQTRRSDRWASEPSEPATNWWAVLAVLLALAGCGVAALVAAAVKGSVEIGDDAGLVLVGVAPSLGTLGVVLGIVGTRRGSLRWLAWLGVALGSVLVLVTIAAVTAVVVSMRTLG
jgi:hypothetical protein